MGTKKWSEIKKLSRATEADRVEARAELADELEVESSKGAEDTAPGKVRSVELYQDQSGDRWRFAISGADGVSCG